MTAAMDGRVGWRKRAMDGSTAVDLIVVVAVVVVVVVTLTEGQGHPN